MKLFLTSDHHFFHKNIIKYCNRPYECIDEMHEKMIKEWNSVVPKDGIIIHMGDFICGGTFEQIKEIVDQLNGHKIITLGNHDGRSRGWFNRVGFDKVYKRHFRVGDILFSHIPCDIHVLNTMGNMYNIHGHSHKHQYGYPYFNAGVDLHNFKPIEADLSITERELMDEKD